MRGLPLVDEDGRAARWYFLVVDIHEKREAEEALDRTRSELARVRRSMTLGALTASIAHEVNQPLSGIITNASLRLLAASPPPTSKVPWRPRGAPSVTETVRPR